MALFTQEQVEGVIQFQTKVFAGMGSILLLVLTTFAGAHAAAEGVERPNSGDDWLTLAIVGVGVVAAFAFILSGWLMQQHFVHFPVLTARLLESQRLPHKIMAPSWLWVREHMPEKSRLWRFLLHLDYLPTGSLLLFAALVVIRIGLLL